MSRGVDTVTSVIRPMLAKLVADIPPRLYYEPKWDGFRAIVVRDGDAIEIHSRNGKPMARYFPDLVEAFRSFLPARCVVDGEIVVIDPATRRLDFFALQQRVHPAASRVDRLAAETPASFVGFDLLGIGEEDLMPRPFHDRRALLEATLGAVPPPLHVTPITRDEALAREWFERFEGAGLDGIIAKDGTHAYQPNVRAMYKVKHQRTVDCVVCGYRLHKTEPDAIGSLLLGLYNDGEGAPSWAKSFGGLLPIGATASFPMARRRDLLTELRPLEIDAADHPWHGAMRSEREGNRWNPAREQQFVALAPERVIEVRYDHMDGGFFRHPATFLRWRPDRDPESCGFAQLEQPTGFDVGEILS
jgi:ATP-dependent DNA ligase